MVLAKNETLDAKWLPSVIGAVLMLDQGVIAFLTSPSGLQSICSVAMLR
jgi:hypothetical protein